MPTSWHRNPSNGTKSLLMQLPLLSMLCRSRQLLALQARAVGVLGTLHKTLPGVEYADPAERVNDATMPMLGQDLHS